MAAIICGVALMAAAVFSGFSSLYTLEQAETVFQQQVATPQIVVSAVLLLAGIVCVKR